jgi:hypothetical protein
MILFILLLFLGITGATCFEKKDIYWMLHSIVLSDVYCYVPHDIQQHHD